MTVSSEKSGGVDHCSHHKSLSPHQACRDGAKLVLRKSHKDRDAWLGFHRMHLVKSESGFLRSASIYWGLEERVVFYKDMHRNIPDAQASGPKV